MYKLYAQNKKLGWQILKTTNDLEKIKNIGNGLNPKEYFSYMIKEISDKGEAIIYSKEFYKECEVKYTSDVETSFEVKALTFRPSRMKQKEELRKMTEEYLK